MSFAVTLVGLVSSFLFALAAFYQQRAARRTSPEGTTFVTGAYALMAKLLRSSTWLGGWAINLLGFGAQALALQLGSVAIVQPLLATQLLFALLMSSLERRIWPTSRDWASGAAICLGVVVLRAMVPLGALGADADRSRVLLATGAVLILLVTLVPVAMRVGRKVRVFVFAGCAGLCFAMTAVFIKLTTEDLVDRGVAATAVDWVGYALAGSTLVGLVLQQGAFANGPLPWTIATTNSVNPLASYAVGVLAFPVVISINGETVAGLTMSAALFVAGAFGLALSDSATLWLSRSQPQAPVL